MREVKLFVAWLSISFVGFMSSLFYSMFSKMDEANTLLLSILISVIAGFGLYAYYEEVKENNAKRSY